MERLQKAGINKIAAIHRGFSTYGKSKYRNQPQWEIPIELRRQHPEVPIICDPSHICGRRDLLQEVSQKALDLNFDGLMIEAHVTPEKALSDAKQQVTPDRLGEILASLVRRESHLNDPQFQHDIEDLRLEIDKIDRNLIDILAERMKVAEKIGKYKKANNMTIFQSVRWNEIIEDRLSYSNPQGLSDDILTEILQMVHKESIRHQTAVMNRKED